MSTPPDRPSVLWAVTGAALIAAAIAAEPLGYGGGLKQAACGMAGVTLVALRAWGGQVAPGTACTPARMLGLWIWIGVLCGFCDAARAAFEQFATDTVVHLPPDYVWMMPAAYALLFGGIGGLWLAAARVVRGFTSLPVLVTAATMLAVYSVTRPFGALHALAGLALSAGAATVLARAAAAHPERVVRAYRYTVLGSLGLVVVATGAVRISVNLAESSITAALPPARGDSPNVLLIVLDTVRADHCGMYGYERATTPAMDRLADAGVVFEHAHSTAPWTLTSHASMFTGRYPHEMNANWATALDEEHATLAEVLGTHGYTTAGFAGNLGNCDAPLGLDRGFSRYEDYYIEPSVFATCASLGQSVLSRSREELISTILRNDAVTITDSFLDWVANQPEDRPFFAFLNYFDAHGMYVPEPPFDTMFGERPSHLDRLGSDFNRWRGWLWSGRANQEFIDTYDACIAFIDHHVERLVRELEQRGVMENTVLIITSDHGELFGEHGQYEHATCIHRPSLHVPWIVYAPGLVPGGTRVEHEVSLVDLPATVLDLAGVEPSMPGVSLTPLWAGGGPVGSPVLAEVSKGVRRPPSVSMRSLLADGLYFIESDDGTEQLFDVREDPLALQDVLDARPEDAAKMRAALRAARGGN